MPLPLMIHSALALFAQRTRIPTSARSIGFCVIWVCISSSSSSSSTQKRNFRPGLLPTFEPSPEYYADANEMGVPPWQVPNPATHARPLASARLPKSLFDTGPEGKIRR